MSERINIGRKFSGGIFNGLFGNPVRETRVSPQYRTYFQMLKRHHPTEVQWLQDKLRKGAVLYCPGCGIGSKICHARIIEQELDLE